MMQIFRRHRHLKHEVLSEYLDGRLHGRDRERVAAEVAGCPACREELESLRATVAMLRQLPVAIARRSFIMAAAPTPRLVGAYGHTPRQGGQRPPLLLRMPQWVYAGAASVAMLALAVMVSADATGLLAPSGGSGPIASRQFAAEEAAKRGPDVAQDADSESAPAPPGEESRAVAPAAATPSAAAAPEAAAKPTSEPQMDATPRVAASRAPQPEPTAVEPPAQANETAGPGPDGTPPPPPAAGPGGLAVAPTQAVPGKGEVLTPEAPLATETPQMAVEPTPAAQSEAKHPSEDGSERGKLAGQRRGISIGWRVLEGVAAALGLSFLIGLVLRRRVSRRIRGV